MRSAVLRAVAYADVFDWPLTPAELHRYLPLRSTRDEVAGALLDLCGDAPAIELPDGYVTLAGRSAIVTSRQRRETRWRSLWPRAARWARVVRGLPFVRMVAVTGSLAVGDAGDGADVDLFVIVEPGRLWLTRAMAMAVARVARLGRLRLCPNYLLDESVLCLEDRTVFTAHELSQMVPIASDRMHAELLRRNRWYGDFLPNAAAPSTRRAAGGRGRARAAGVPRRLAETVLRSRVFDGLERREMRRKIAQLSRVSSSAEVRYDATTCKGHADGHGARVLAAYESRLRALGEMR